MDSRPPVLCAPFFTSCEAMEFAETGHMREERPDLPLSLLIVLHALRLDCEKSMELTASSHRSCFCCSRESRDEGAVRVSPHWGSDKGAIEGLALFVPGCRIVLPASTFDTLFSRRKYALAEILVCPLNIWCGSKYANHSKFELIKNCIERLHKINFMI